MANLNVLPLWSYDILIAMDWFETHSSLINYKTKTINYMDNEGKRLGNSRHTKTSEIKASDSLPIMYEKILWGLLNTIRIYQCKV